MTAPELIERLNAFAHDYPCIHCGCGLLNINSRNQVICLRCLGENPFDEKGQVMAEAAKMIAALQSRLEAADNATLEEVDNRDAYEEAFADAYFLVMGRAIEWTNLYGVPEALSDMRSRLEARVKPLVWHESPVYETDDYGCEVWGEFQPDTIVATCKTIYCGIYRHSFDKFMWVDGTLDNIRYSTYRKPPAYEKVEIPWFDSVDAAKDAAQADYKRRILSALCDAPGGEG